MRTDYSKAFLTGFYKTLLFEHPLADLGLQQFAKDWQAAHPSLSAAPSA